MRRLLKQDEWIFSNNSFGIFFGVERYYRMCDLVSLFIARVRVIEYIKTSGF